MAEPKKFKVLKTRIIGSSVCANEGDTVFDCWSCDYGLANDDTRFTGVEHRSVTHDPAGKYPFFTIPVRDLQEIKE